MKGTLNDTGGAQFVAQPKFDAKAPGMLKANLLTKVYENGGDFSTDVFTTKLSTYTHYVGLKAPKETTSSNYLYTDKSYNFEVAAVDENGTGNARDLEVTVYKLSWSWWWNSAENGLYDYSGSKYHEPYNSYTIKTNNNGKGSFALKVSENDWGRYLIKVKDKRSKHTSAAVVYFDWPSWYVKKKGNIDKSNATMLVFTTDKDSYKVSESATVKFLLLQKAEHYLP
ncbi:hypothetical protein [Tenacibaculum sp. SG-28]|uniref:hypothetical protein n=1 Tax=Tenacibaculum sp. SG-28 TaxID=754426 RepID=UPI000CF490C0|nr:hypothetical protein [Tenacibaculum sp. SG-28]